MTDVEIRTNQTCCEGFETKTEDFSTNPIKANAEVQSFSWLDDYGWI